MDMYSIIGIVAFISFLYVLISVLSNKRMKAINKAIWIVFAMIFSIITAIVYYFKIDKK